ncbi:MAG: toll/interleukin-1 receptor domain-containing protein, partial [Prochlorotrichaceae cyanobacterium]
MDDFDTSFTKLLTLFDQHKAYVHRHTELLIRALEWEQHQKRSQFLLVGDDRTQAESWLKTRFSDSQPPCLPTDLHCEFITESIKNAENLMTQVFLSYADSDRSVATEIRQRLMREGLTVWMNTTDIATGVDFETAINRGIEEADNVVYCLSPASLESMYCQQEIDYALQLNKRIIPILVTPVEPNQVPDALKLLQYIDLTDNTVEADRLADESQLLRTLYDNALYHEQHKFLLVKALKWQRQQQNPTLLLRGYNLQSFETWWKLAQQNPQYPPTALQGEFLTASLQQPPGIALDVFISYSRVDSGIARQINNDLQTQGKRTWFDQESIAAGTADFQAEIHHGIESADHFLFILSPNAIASPYCADEVEYAARLNKRFVTLLHRPIETANLHPELARVQWLDFDQGGYSKQFQALLRILDTDPEHLHAHTRLLLRAIEWDEKERKESLLLRGDELETAEQWLENSGSKEPKPTELQQQYINNSRSVEAANQQATEILRAAAAKGKRLIWTGGIAATIGLGIAVIAGFVAYQAKIQLDIANLQLTIAQSQEQFLSGQMFEALLTSLKSVKDLRETIAPQNPEWKSLKAGVENNLGQAMRSVREINTLT